MILVVFAIVVLALVFGPGLWVQRVLARYSAPADRYAGTGGDLESFLRVDATLEQHRIGSELGGGSRQASRAITTTLTPKRCA